MMLTKDHIILSKYFMIKIPAETKRLKDLSENRWGYKKSGH
tara:strand:+ start:700 stop:822 length:123 start_codon:yes stop_codon:yes gene_type:complete